MIVYQKYREEFDSILDEKSEIKIGSNFSMPPSQILFEMDETAYQEQLIEYVNQKKEDYPGTIEKVSDFLIFHPSYPTFSSCLQIKLP